MINTPEEQENLANFKLEHFTTGQGSLDEYRDNKTGKIVKVIMKNDSGERTVLECDPATGKLNELTEYDRDGKLIRLSDQKAIREALQEGNVWHARMLEEIKIQGGNASVAASMIDKMLNEEMFIPEDRQ